MFINEDANVQEWRKMLVEQFGVEDKSKLNWISQYAAVHEIYESNLGYNCGVEVPGTNGVGPIYATPLNTMGMGNPTAPANYAAQGSTTPSHFWNQKPGSGDIPQSTLPMSLNVALLTIGLELLPVIPAKTPWQMVSYMDFPYAGGKMNVTGNLTSLDGFGEGKENKPIYIKVLGSLKELATIGDALKAKYKALEKGEKLEVEVKSEKGTFKGYYKGIGRNDGGILLETISCVKADEATPSPISPIFNAEEVTVDEIALPNANADFVQTSADFIDGFANFADGGKRSMTRAENETGTGNTIGLRLFTKWIQVGSYEVTGTVTRQQLQDLPLYGIDATGKIMEALQNEITQHINARILERVFALGVTNAVQQKHFQNVDLNLYLGTNTQDEKELAEFGIDNYTDIYGNDHAEGWMVANREALTSAENTATRQRRISSRILAAANLIQTVGRRGRPTWIVTNAKVASALEDCSGYVVNPMVNNLAQDGTKNLYLNGTLAGLKVYVDPYMAWDDCRICVGRKGDGNSPGAIFMPYILADQVTITAEGTMAPKMLVNSRYALETIGFYPAAQYYTFAVYSDFDII